MTSASATYSTHILYIRQPPSGVRLALRYGHWLTCSVPRGFPHRQRTSCAPQIGSSGWPGVMLLSGWNRRLISFPTPVQKGSCSSHASPACCLNLGVERSDAAGSAHWYWYSSAQRRWQLLNIGIGVVAASHFLRWRTAAPLLTYRNFQSHAQSSSCPSSVRCRSARTAA